ncbi:glycosyltransferase family 20-domain-containing protein [Dipodascopsis uninucleata]
MTLLVVCLYLPNTIDFNLNDPSLVEQKIGTPVLSQTPSLSTTYDLPSQAPSAGTSSVSTLTTSGTLTNGPLPNFIQSLASRVTSAHNTPPPSPPLTTEIEEFFFKTGSGTSSSSHLPNLVSSTLADINSSSNTASTPSALEFENNFRSEYARSMKKIAETRPNTASPSNIGTAFRDGSEPLSGSPDSMLSSTSQSRLSGGNRPPLTMVTHPRSRANSPPPAKSLVDERRQSIPNVPSLRMAPKRPKNINVVSPSEAASVFSRAPWTVVKFSKGNGGLRNAIARAQAEGTVQDVKWIGTLGMPTDALELSTKAVIENILKKDHNNIPVFAGDSTIEGHYTHYCKDILWPTFHYQIPDNPKSKAYEDHSWVHYHALNKAFADTVIKNYKPGDIIWVHDYHLLLVPGMVREKLPEAKIGFFLHIAFPSSEVYRCLPARKTLLEGMLGADVVGFQTREYARHFRQTCEVVLGLHSSGNYINYKGRRLSVVDISIGIDPPSLQLAAENADVKQWRTMLRERWPDMKLIVGRDKLDQFRGVRNKMLGYERFLKFHPEWKEKVIFIQVCLTNIACQDLESDVSDIVTRINSSNSHVGSEPPVVFLHQDISFEQYLALLFEADAFVVTSLREGMNLTCHEYIFCQEQSSKGPLILSEFTGSASVLGDKCLLVNPWDKVEVADAFYKALTMPLEERKERCDALYSEVMTNTCAHWVKLFLRELDAVCDKRYSN